jgi:flagellin
VFQIGANEGEDMGVNIGDMRAESLGLTRVLVTDRESAARSITIIDNAIDKVSMQRAKLGAYQNRLEHTITNLTVAGENLTAAESRIRDTDMAKEMMNFTKLQIMLQAGTSMLAQANALPQNVLGLLR